MKSVLLSSGSRPAHGRSRTPGLGTPWSPADGSWGWRGTGHGADTFLWVAEGLTPFPLAELRAGRASSPCKASLCPWQHRPTGKDVFQQMAHPWEGPRATTGTRDGQENSLPHLPLYLTATSLSPLPSLWDQILGSGIS